MTIITETIQCGEGKGRRVLHSACMCNGMECKYTTMLKFQWPIFRIGLQEYPTPGIAYNLVQAYACMLLGI